MRITRHFLTALSLAILAMVAAGCPQSGGEQPRTTSNTGSAVTSSGAEATGQVQFAGNDFRFTTFDNVEHKLSDYAGKPVVLNFFGIT